MTDPRRARRGHLTDAARLELLEDDLDDLDTSIEQFRLDIKEDMAWLRRTLILFVIGIATSAIGLAVTIILTSGGKP